MRKRLPAVLAAVLSLVLAGQPAVAAPPPNAHTWVNAKTGKCLAVSGGIMDNGTPIIQWDCNGNIDQYWYEVDTSGDQSFQEFRSAKDSQFCLAVPNGTEQIGVQLVIWKCSDNWDQLWDPIPVRLDSGTRWLLHNLQSWKFAAVSGGLPDRGRPVIQWDATGNLDQYWFPRY